MSGCIFLLVTSPHLHVFVQTQPTLLPPPPNKESIKSLIFAFQEFLLEKVSW